MVAPFVMVSRKDFGKVRLTGGPAGKTSKYPWSDLVPDGPGFFVEASKPPRAPLKLARVGRRFSIRKAAYRGKQGYFVTRKSL